MKLKGIVCIGLLAVASVAHGQRGNRNDDTGAVGRACTINDCFLEGQVRDFEVIDKTHLIVYVGSQRCAFHVELRGAFCDMTFAPELHFRPLNEVPLFYTRRGEPEDSDVSPNDILPRSSGREVDPVISDQRERRDARICDNDLTMQVHGGAPFTEFAAQDQPTDRFGNPRTECRVASVRSITDDQVVELLVGRKVVPPLPPMGQGEIEVGEQEEGENGTAPTRRSNDERDN